ncbi:MULTISPECIES: peptidoglycan-associated lipoprotein Pal [unclassified Pseudodesulfovibrio]|uniref:peptidoglycan-associated lipoprotein Pal n=1 Tax=unclassified Pseudodesulfovibrio TaxID=2661612 RepID=UPI000FEBE3A5|nr:MULTISPECIES: peptidoglycan-associated lipoprotein Pal [unclassified Pseudodesulfovibrio]MCJ2163972.1 peptidoglycan-associated lipoprotein Pal [Pseudodesulfovibrio sp. S3-i]RWU05784.1 peptidoglycan-associated lipoprotein Pal [Pseudodesulfovibrio sp. S3]
MRIKWYVCIVALLALSLLVFTGCAKKTTSTAPSDAKVEVNDDTQWTPPQQDTAVDEDALAAEAEARAKAEAVEELTSVTLHFAFNSYELNEESRSILALKANILRKFTDVNVVIEGHCDERGTEEYNLALGERRARASYEHLVILGVDPERMKIVSFGEEYPVDPAHNESAWAKNRRAEFVVK